MTKRITILFIAGLTTTILLMGLPGVFAAKHVLIDQPAPEFTHQEKIDWINTKPISLKDLKGQVVLIDFWTFGCWNCYRSFPWLNSVQKQNANNPFTIISVHSPEFEREHDRGKVIEKVAEFELDHPIMIDNDFSYWRALNNHYWPAYYLIDKRGIVREVFVGETHQGDRKARRIAALINELVTEASE